MGISVPKVVKGQFLASPIISSGKGATMANAVYGLSSEYGLNSRVKSMVFDTTASNTGICKGSVTLFERKIGTALLWLACRHHVPERHITHANEALRGSSKGPDDPLFKRFKECFPMINTENRSVWTWPADQNSWRHQMATEVLQWASVHMELATWDREDYRELLELVSIYLGDIVKRVRKGNVVVVNDVIRKPGAIHRARFMASCLYLLKIFIFNEQIDADTIDLEELEDVKVLAEYIALLHAPYFLQCPLAVSAPRLDIKFWIDVKDYKRCFNENQIQFDMLTAVQVSLINRHVSGLVPILVNFWTIYKTLDFSTLSPIFIKHT